MTRAVLPQAKDCRERPEAGRIRNRFSSRASRGGGGAALPTPRFETSGLQIRKKRNPCCLSRPVGGDLLWQPQDTNHPDFPALPGLAEAVFSPLPASSSLSHLETPQSVTRGASQDELILFKTLSEICPLRADHKG